MQRSFFTYLLSLVIFGANGLFVAAISLNGPQTALVRNLIGGTTLWILCLVTGQLRDGMPSRSQLKHLVLSGVFLGLGAILLYTGYSLTGVGMATLLYYTGPMIILALAPVIFGERLTREKIICFAVVVVGMVMVNWHAFGGGGSLRGIAYGLASAGCFAAMVIFSKKANAAGPSTSAIQVTVAFAAIGIYVMFNGGIPFAIPRSDWLPLLLMGVVSGGLATFLYFTSMKRLSVQTVSVTGYVEPVAAVLMSVAFLGERLDTVQSLGAACIIGGAVGCELWKAKVKEIEKDLSIAEADPIFIAYVEPAPEPRNRREAFRRTITAQMLRYRAFRRR